MRELLSEEKRAARGGGGGNGGNASSSGNHPSQLLLGKFQRSFRAFLNGGAGDQTTASTQRSPRPWETGPDSLRLPRYVMVMRALSLSLEGAGGESAADRRQDGQGPRVEFGGFGDGRGWRIEQ